MPKEALLPPRPDRRRADVFRRLQRPELRRAFRQREAVGAEAIWEALPTYSAVRKAGIDRKRIDRLLGEGYRVRKKVIKGKGGAVHEYAYGQKGRKYVSFGPWAESQPYLPTKNSTAKGKEASPGSAADLVKNLKKGKAELEAKAINDNSYVPEYVSQVVRNKDKPTWDRLYRFSDGHWQDAVMEAIHMVPPYAKRLEEAVYGERETPKYFDYVIDTLGCWFAKYKEEKRGSLRPRGVVASTCPKCGSTLAFYRDPDHDFETYQFYCERCHTHSQLNCTICGSRMSFCPDSASPSVFCPECGYACSFTQPPELRLPKTKEGAKLEEAIGSKLDRRKRTAIVSRFEHDLFRFENNPARLYFGLRGAGLEPAMADTVMMGFLMETDSRTADSVFQFQSGPYESQYAKRFLRPNPKEVDAWWAWFNSTLPWD